MTLSTKDIRHLRALGHALNPLLQIGKDGITEGLVRATARGLTDHELIKAKVSSEAPEDRRVSAAALAEATGSDLVQVIGRTFLLFKRREKKPEIVLPSQGGATKKRAPKVAAGEAARPSGLASRVR